jgi:hypothetical protein
MFFFTKVPSGAFPTQGEGVIEETGQVFYFRYRGGRASLTISQDDRLVTGGSEGVARRYEQRVVSEDAMPLSLSTTLITAWLTLYLAEPRAQVETRHQHPALADIQRSSRWS